MRTAVDERDHVKPVLAAIVGAGGGLLGAWAMVRFQHLLGGTENGGDSRPQRRRQATPNDTDATLPDEPATMKAASAAAEAITGRPLDESGKQIGGPVVHYAFGAAMGALYGLAAEFRPDATALAGVPFGAAVWIAADEFGVPAVGLARNPTEYPLSRHAAAFASHIVFGLTVEGVRRVLLGKRYDPDLA